MSSLNARSLLSVAEYNDIWTGIYVWEYVTSLAYDWQYLTGRKERRWTTWMYLACRFMTLASLSLSLAVADVYTRRPFHCFPLYATAVAFSYIAFQIATLLMALRTLVVWNYWRPVVVLVLAGWTTNLAVMIWSIIGAKAFWQQTVGGGTCVSPFNTRNNRVLEIVTFGVDTALVLCLLVGLRHKENRQTPSGLWGLLHRQAVLWLGVVLLAELPAVVLTLVSFKPEDVVFNEMHLLPKLTIITISATRMYRSLNLFITVNITQRTHVRGASETTIALETMGNMGKKVQPLVVNVHTEQIQYTSDADVATQQATTRALRHRNRYRAHAEPTMLSVRDLRLL